MCNTLLKLTKRGYKNLCQCHQSLIDYNVALDDPDALSDYQKNNSNLKTGKLYRMVLKQVEQYNFASEMLCDGVPSLASMLVFIYKYA
jgi:hypothetical protein